MEALFGAWFQGAAEAASGTRTAQGSEVTQHAAGTTEVAGAASGTQAAQGAAEDGIPGPGPGQLAANSGAAMSGQPVAANGTVRDQPVAASGTADATCGTVWNLTNRMTMMEELGHLRQLVEWGELRDIMASEIKTGKSRQVLSHHTSSACQPWKAHGTVGGNANLKDAGMDTPLADHGVIIELLSSYHVNDALWLQYESGPARSHAEAKERACLDILQFLLVSAPRAVHLPPRAFVGGEGSIETFKEAAWRCQYAYVTYLRSLSTETGQPVAASPLLAHVDQTHGPRFRPTPVGAARTCLFEPLDVAAGETQETRDDLLIAFLRQHLRTGRAHWPNQLPPEVFQELGRKLPARGLCDFMMRHPRVFEVRATGRNTIQAFRLIPVADPPDEPHQEHVQTPPGLSGPSPASGSAGAAPVQRPPPASGSDGRAQAHRPGAPDNYWASDPTHTQGDIVVVPWWDARRRQQEHYTATIEWVDERRRQVSVRLHHTTPGPYTFGFEGVLALRTPRRVDPTP